jgi:LPS export ABC transporter protein LptC
MRLLKSIIFLSIAAVALTISCTETDTPVPKQTDNNFPDTKLDDATILLSQDGRQSVKVLAEHIDRWEKNDSTEAMIVRVIFYDTTGSIRSTLNADRGLIRENSDEIAMFGSVVGVGDDSTVLKTESLFWDAAKNQITTEDYVEITEADGSLLTGYGLRTDPGLKDFEILRDVSGKVKEVPGADKEKPKKK